MNLEIKNLPQEVQKLFNIFQSDARLVGGCVRDLLLGKAVKDFDFATRFLPQETIQILQKNKIKALETGVKYGTVTAVINGKNFEITTLRQDENQRGRDTDVKFVDDYLLDAERRDFTINALYLDFEGKIYDYFDGISDLKNQKVKFIGDAAQRISEDFLRILRFFRFTQEYAQGFDDKALQACILQKSNLKKLSRERIRGEFVKIFQTQKQQKLFENLQVMEGEKILAEIFTSTSDVKALKTLLKLDPNCQFHLKIATLFLTKENQVEQFSTEICATNKERKFFNLLFKASSQFDLKALRRLLASHDKEFVIEFYLFHLAKNHDISAENLKYLNDFELPQFPFSAQDLIAKGLQGKEISSSLAKLKEDWADNDFKLKND